jgi:branched-chain amino acid transport system ATP-binding protein
VNPILSVEALSAGYNTKSILHGLSFQVFSNEIVALIGSNGAGKTTTLRVISGLLKSRSGSIRFNDTEITGCPPHEIVTRGLIHIPEARRLFGAMTVKQNLVLGGYARAAREAEATIEEVYGAFPKLKERSDQLAGSLSGGEQQMLAIGRGLMAKPRLLMLDEPTMGLSPKVTRAIVGIIESVRQLGIPVLLIEQNAHLALEVSQRAYVVQLGRIVKEGASAELAEDPSVRQAYLGLE